MLKRFLFFFVTMSVALSLKDLAFPDLSGWPNWLLAAATGGIIGGLTVRVFEEKA
jgi:hypothetical protein